MSWIVAGLGNPDKEYNGTRHNIGFSALDFFAGKDDWEESSKARALYKKTGTGKKEIEFLKPLTYVNKSGEAIAYAAKKNGIKSDHIVVVHDDLDLPLGKIKISFGSGSGGHKGVESIQKRLKTRDFVRFRIGISPSTPSGKVRKPDAKKVVDFVLGKFKPGEQEKLKKAHTIVAEGLRVLLTDSLARAMTEVNSK